MADQIPFSNILLFFSNRINEVVSTRYLGDYEFLRFKSLLKHLCGFFIGIVLLGISIAYILLAFLSTTFLKILCNLSITDFIAWIGIAALFLYFLLIFWNFLVDLYNIGKYIKYEKMPNNIEWKEWSPKDFILIEPLYLEEKKKISFEIWGQGGISFLCQYPTGHIRWLGFNNLGVDYTNEKESVFSKDLNKVIAKPIVNLMKYNLEDNKTNFGELKPFKILGLRVRNMGEKPINIKKIKII